MRGFHRTRNPRVALLVLAVVWAAVAWFLFLRSGMPLSMPEGLAIDYSHSSGMIDKSETYHLAVGPSKATLRRDGAERTYAFDVTRDELDALYRTLRAERFLGVVATDPGMIYDAPEWSVTLSWNDVRKTIRDGATEHVVLFDRQRFFGGAQAISDFVDQKISDAP